MKVSFIFNSLSFLKNYFFLNFWLHWIFVAACRLSLESGGLLSNCSVQASHCGGFSLQSMGSRACRLQQLQLPGVVAPWHVESSQIMDLTHVLCISRQIPNHQTTKEDHIHYLISASNQTWKRVAQIFVLFLPMRKSNIHKSQISYMQ